MDFLSIWLDTSRTVESTGRVISSKTAIWGVKYQPNQQVVVGGGRAQAVTDACPFLKTKNLSEIFQGALACFLKVHNLYNCPGDLVPAHMGMVSRSLVCLFFIFPVYEGVFRPPRNYP